MGWGNSQSYTEKHTAYVYLQTQTDDSWKSYREKQNRAKGYNKKL